MDLALKSDLLRGAQSEFELDAVTYSSQTPCYVSYAVPGQSYALPSLSYALLNESYALPNLSYALPNMRYTLLNLSYALPLSELRIA
jgi:hypothetical protein